MKTAEELWDQLDSMSIAGLSRERTLPIIRAALLDATAHGMTLAAEIVGGKENGLTHWHELHEAILAARYALTHAERRSVIAQGFMPADGREG